MNEEATAYFTSIINDPKLLPLSSFKSNKFSKYNIFPHARSLPPFFDTNLQSQGRIVKYLKGPEGPLRAFYYQLFKLGYEIQTSIDYSATIKNIIFSPTLTTSPYNQPSGKQYNINQNKRIIAQFLKVLQGQVIPNAQLTFSQYPIIDEAMLAILQLIVQTRLQKRDSRGKIQGEELYRYGVGCVRMENLTIMLKGLCEMFHINLEVFDNCYSFVQSDVFLYVENPQISYLAFLSQMAEVQSYEKTSESKSGMDKEKEQISSGYLQPQQEFDPDVYKDIRLSTGNRPPRGRISGNLNRSLPGNNKKNYSLNSSQTQNNILTKDYEIEGIQNQPAYPSQQNQNNQYMNSNQEDEQKDDTNNDNLQKNVFDSNNSSNEDEKNVDLEQQLKELKQQLHTEQKQVLQIFQSEEEGSINHVQQGIRQIQQLIKAKPIQSANVIDVEENRQQPEDITQNRVEKQIITKEFMFTPIQQPKPETESQRFSKTSSDPIQITSQRETPPEKQQPKQQNKNTNQLIIQEKVDPKSLYDVHTQKSITSFNSVVQTKAQPCDVSDLRAISQYQLRSLGTLKQKQKTSIQIAQADKNQRKGLFGRKKDYYLEQGETGRRKSQVKLNNVVYQYQFKAFKYQKSNIKPVSIDAVIQSSKQKNQGLIKNQIRKITESYSLTIKNEKFPQSSRQSILNKKQIQTSINPQFISPQSVEILKNQSQSLGSSLKSNKNQKSQDPELQFFVPKPKNIENPIKLSNKIQNRRDRLGQKPQANTFAKANDNSDSLGTFYREFSNTKIMQAMIQPFKTKVRTTRQKFKGIRGKDFKGFH